MMKNVGNLIADNIEKVTLPILALLCLIFLFTGVLVSPNKVEYKNKNYNPTEIDPEVLKEARIVEDVLTQKPKSSKDYNSVLQVFLDTMNAPVKIDSKLGGPIIPPPKNPGKEVDGRQYALPSGPVIEDPKIERMRAVAYFPKENTADDLYSMNLGFEHNDVDLVTVEAKLELASLYEAFEEAFNGMSVKPQWRDPDLAEPIFAAVHLQRSEKLEDGSWAEPVDIPRLKIDPRSDMMEIIENVEDLPRGGMKVRLLHFSSLEIMSEVVQPLSYQIASADQFWYPPSFHSRFIKVVEKQSAKIRRAEMQRIREEREREREENRSKQKDGRKRTDTQRETYVTDDTIDELPTRMRPVKDNRRDEELEEKRRRREQEMETPGDIAEEFEGVLVENIEDLRSYPEPLLFWAIDDTVESGKTYRYQIRLGVFNPVAGTAMIKPEYQQYKNQVIIWSNTLETDEIEIPKKMYFFAKDIKDVTKTVKVEVCRYAMGYWHSKEYPIQVGEEIGRIDDIEQPQKPQNEDAEGFVSNEFSFDIAETTLPEQVDFSTGAVMVDAVIVDDWAGISNLRSRHYYKMLYTYDGSLIESMPIKQIYWPDDMRIQYRNIQNSVKKTRRPLRPPGSSYMEQSVYGGGL